MKETLLTDSNIGTLFKGQSWYSLPSIINVRKFHRQHQCTFQRLSGHDMACRSSEGNLTFLYAGQTTLHSDSFISETVPNRTHVHMNFLLGMTDTMTYQYIDLFSWYIRSVYVCMYVCMYVCVYICVCVSVCVVGIVIEIIHRNAQKSEVYPVIIILK